MKKEDGMNVTEARGLLVNVRKLQIYARRLQRRVGGWDWAGAIEHGYLGEDRISFLRSMALLRLRA